MASLQEGSVRPTPPCPYNNPDRITESFGQQPQLWVTHLADLNDFINSMMTQDSSLHARFQEAERDLIELQAKLAEHVGTIQDGHDTITNQRRQIDLMQQRITDLLIQPSQTTSLVRGSSKEERSTKHPDPEAFGGDRASLKEFLTQLGLKLYKNDDWYPTEASKVAYAIGRLKDEALHIFSPFVLDKGVNIPDLGNFKLMLEQAFGDPDPRSTAIEKLSTMRQANREVAIYIAEFMQYARDTEWDDATLRNMFERGLSEEIRDRLITVDPPKDYAEFITYIRVLDSKIQHHERHKRKHQPRAPTAARTPSAAAITLLTTETPRNLTTATGTQSGPMDLSTNRKKLSLEEIKRRMDLGLCRYCGEAGHFVSSCPKAPARNLQASEAYLDSSSTTSKGVNTPLSSENE